MGLPPRILSLSVILSPLDLQSARRTEPGAKTTHGSRSVSAPYQVVALAWSTVESLSFPTWTSFTECRHRHHNPLESIHETSVVAYTIRYIRVLTAMLSYLP
ncbi:hypothetical protein CALCODRAFT_271365 [Calocera cornea HHB12733]|uniref:Uncharacterized protein n=1 Tax=Calocera cornea HHB12733 TaxID=1353952 RepID=A0A165G9U1_9BASI|nr:hypothetical protein CALCODRAFT_271365 [Calocera cornea HHB12733]